jgi:NADPH-ferrihemoprotein reductase
MQYDAKHPFYGRVIQSKSIFSGSIDSQSFPNSDLALVNEKAIVDGKKVTIERKCFHVELDLWRSGLTYKTGDHVGIWADNNTKDVEKFSRSLKLQSIDEVIELVPNADNPMSSTATLHMPTPCSIRVALRHYLDIAAFAKQHHFEVSSSNADHFQVRD